MTYPIRAKALMQFGFGENIVGSVKNLELKFWSKNKKLQKVFFPPWN